MNYRVWGRVQIGFEAVTIFAGGWAFGWQGAAVTFLILWSASIARVAERRRIAEIGR